MPRLTVAAPSIRIGGRVLTAIENHEQVDVFVGLDVGKGGHHAVALDRAGKRLYDKALPNDESKVRAVLGQLQQHGVVLLVVDQPATIGALPVAVARGLTPDLGHAESSTWLGKAGSRNGEEELLG
jgi:hypothetical protein